MSISTFTKKPQIKLKDKKKPFTKDPKKDLKKTKGKYFKSNKKDTKNKKHSGKINQRKVYLKQRLLSKEEKEKIILEKKQKAKLIKIKKTLRYIYFLKKFSNLINYKNFKLLKGFLTKFGNIRSRRKTKIKIQEQRKIAKAIRKARCYGLIPFTCDVKY
jgi:small subunit ribosomal protein S18